MRLRVIKASHGFHRLEIVAWKQFTCPGYQFKGQSEHVCHHESVVVSHNVIRWVTARHVSGTCKMGPDSDFMAVVDQYCSVKGVKSLSVVDASIMPRVRRKEDGKSALLDTR